MYRITRMVLGVWLLIGVITPTFAAKTIDLDTATIADINAAFAAGTLSAEKPVQFYLARFTGDNLPVGISFFGPAFSEQKLLSLGYSFEQATHARRRPVTTPPLKGESLQIP